MSKTTKTPEIDPQKFYLCAVAFYTETTGRYYRKMQRCLGSDPGVQLKPDFFVPESEASSDRIDEAYSDHWNRTLDASTYEITHAPRKVAKVEWGPAPSSPIKLADRVVCISRALVDDGKVSEDEPDDVQVGELASKRWRIVRENPPCFIAVNPRKLDPREALVARADLVTFGRDGKETRHVHAGEWVSVNDPLVEIHPHQFDGAPYEVTARYAADEA